MAYQSLYRKYRPLTFDDVVGQSHITKTLKNEIASQRLSHAFLFCGPRGTGKTSTARILSRAINCRNPVDFNPCNECENCRGVLNGQIMDVEEIDAASYSGVDDIRELRSRAVYTGTELKFKVYIIDEVHNLSSGAFNALLKMLEEPPEHIKFVLATTESHKVPDTISSRCQRFDFKRISAEDIKNRLMFVCKSEGIDADEEALSYIATASDGGMRDALSMLETCIGEDKKVTLSSAVEMSGTFTNENIISLCDAIGRNDATKSLLAIENAVNSGMLISPFFENVIKAFRDMLIMSITKKCESSYFVQEKESLFEISNLYTPEKLLYAIKVCSEAISLARSVNNPRVIFESSVVRLCFLRAGNDIDSILKRLSEIEKRLDEGDFKVKAQPVVKKEKQVPKEEKEKEEVEIEEIPKSQLLQNSSVADPVIKMWPEIISEIEKKCSIMAQTVIQNASIREDNGKLAIVFSDSAGKEMKDMISGDLDTIKKIIKDVCGVDCPVVTRTDSDFSKSGFVGDIDPLDELLAQPFVNVE